MREGRRLRDLGDAEGALRAYRTAVAAGADWRVGWGTGASPISLGTDPAGN
jgi:hypothetical protein